MYSEKVMDHFQHPRNVGEIENASGVGLTIIKDCKFKTFGCGAAVATRSTVPCSC